MSVYPSIVFHLTVYDGDDVGAVEEAEGKEDTVVDEDDAGKAVDRQLNLLCFHP